MNRLTDQAARRPPKRRALFTAILRDFSELSQVASVGVTRPWAINPGSFAAMMWRSRRRLTTARVIASPKMGIIHST